MRQKQNKFKVHQAGLTVMALYNCHKSVYFTFQNLGYLLVVLKIIPGTADQNGPYLQLLEELSMKGVSALSDVLAERPRSLITRLSLIATRQYAICSKLGQI